MLVMHAISKIIIQHNEWNKVLAILLLQCYCFRSAAACDGLRVPVAAYHFAGLAHMWDAPPGIKQW